jgi:hypothetical protein
LDIGLGPAGSFLASLISLAVAVVGFLKVPRLSCQHEVDVTGVLKQTADNIARFHTFLFRLFHSVRDGAPETIDSELLDVAVLACSFGVENVAFGIDGLFGLGQASLEDIDGAFDAVVGIDIELALDCCEAAFVVAAKRNRNEVLVAVGDDLWTGNHDCLLW